MDRQELLNALNAVKAGNLSPEDAVRLLKDYDPNAKPAKLRTTLGKVTSALKAYEPLKAHEDPVVAQEAKNCIADLMWTQAAIKAAVTK